MSADEAPMNPFFVIAIAEKISAMETADFFKRRSAMASKANADKAWAKVGHDNPLPEDRWTAD
jgi:hypothetical protein